MSMQQSEEQLNTHISTSIRKLRLLLTMMPTSTYDYITLMLCDQYEIDSKVQRSNNEGQMRQAHFYSQHVDRTTCSPTLKGKSIDHDLFVWKA